MYWACQIAGWGAYSALGMEVAVLENGWRPSIVIGYVLFFFYSIGLTHLLRREIRRNWTNLPVSRSLMQFAAACISIAAVQSALVVGVYWAIERQLGVWSEKSSIVYMFLGLCVANAIWTTLYLTITGMYHAREAKRNEMGMKLALSNAELKALEAQLNPHFLFNCLNSIRGMIGEDPEHARDMVTRLSNILRYSLQRDRRHTAPLANEMDVVADYLALESVRFEDRLRVHLSVDDAALARPFPPMLLQSLVENAIKHGVEEIPSGGDLSIRVRVEGDELRIEVENTGNLGESRMNSTQMGLANARERLRILYGERARLNLAASGEGRVKATVLIPAVA